MKRKYSICIALLLGLLTGCASADAQTAETVPTAGSSVTTIAETTVPAAAAATTITTVATTSAAHPETTALTSVPETAPPETVITETVPSYETFTGILIDEDCSDFEDPELHDLPCMLMDSCRASGYGLDIQAEDGTWQFLPFDENGQTLAWDYLLQTTQQDHLYVTVIGIIADGMIHVVQLQGRS